MQLMLSVQEQPGSYVGVSALVFLSALDVARPTDISTCCYTTIGSCVATRLYPFHASVIKYVASYQ